MAGSPQPTLSYKAHSARNTQQEPAERGGRDRQRHREAERRRVGSYAQNVFIYLCVGMYLSIYECMSHCMHPGIQ